MKSNRMTCFSIKEIMYYLEGIFLKRRSNNFFGWIIAADVFFESNRPFVLNVGIMMLLYMSSLLFVNKLDDMILKLTRMTQ